MSNAVSIIDLGKEREARRKAMQKAFEPFIRYCQRKMKRQKNIPLEQQIREVKKR